MNLYLRLLLLLLKLPWLPKQKDPLAPSIMTMRVMPNDLDVFLHVNNGRYLTIMDLGRLYMMSATGLLKVTRQKKWAPLLGSIKVHFLKPLTLFQSFTIYTQTVYWDDKWIYVEQKIISKDQLCVTALMKILFIGKSGKIKPQEIVDLLPNPPLTPPPIPQNVKAWQEAERSSRED